MTFIVKSILLIILCAEAVGTLLSMCKITASEKMSDTHTHTHMHAGGLMTIDYVNIICRKMCA